MRISGEYKTMGESGFLALPPLQKYNYRLGSIYMHLGRGEDFDGLPRLSRMMGQSYII